MYILLLESSEVALLTGLTVAATMVRGFPPPFTCHGELASAATHHLLAVARRERATACCPARTVAFIASVQYDGITLQGVPLEGWEINLQEIIAPFRQKDSWVHLTLK